MPANLPPDYFAAEERYRQAKTNEEKIRILEEMLAIMPKHKGTDHLKADLRSKISRLQKEGSKKKVVARYNPYAVEREDCPQVVLIGPPNSGKSSLLNALTGAASEAAEYPYTTVKPFPGIFRCDNFRFQLLDLPPIVGDSMEGWMGDLIRASDGAMIVLDVSRAETMNEMETLFIALDNANVFLQGLKGENPPLGTIPKTAIAALNKSDAAAPEALESLKGEFEERFITVKTSAVGNPNSNDICRGLARCLKVMRIYTKIPGRQADMDEPYIVNVGTNVISLAGIVHRELAENFKYARVWGGKTFDGQRVGKEHRLEDEYVVELH
ncbi:MAG: 50S ribosome-binding GTPase [candidate division Zixibacteria bacterium]|nr:50S ribosome-binding GTPase [Candidatus Tariuqbacter arcticus]